MSSPKFQDQLRLRVCGILVEEARVLLVQLKSPVTDKLVWMPPGGGLEFGESIEACLEREFTEETGLKIRKKSLAFINEMIRAPYHAVECYFWVDKTDGQLRMGNDPELLDDDQLLQDIRWVPITDLDKINVAPKQLRQRIREVNSNTAS